MKSLKTLLPLLLIFLGSCKKDYHDLRTDVNPSPNQRFNYETSVPVKVVLSAGIHLKGAAFELYTDKPKDGGKLLAKGVLDATASFRADYRLSTSQKSVFLKSIYVGLPGDITIPIENNKAFYDFEKDDNVSNKKSSGKLKGTTTTVNNTLYTYMGTYNAAGVPDYLTTADVIDQSLLSDINVALPEGSQVPAATPHYLATNNDVDVHLDELCDVWITFVHEGAGYKNVLAYYTYPTDNPPQTVNDIDTVKVIFPNVSYPGSGGALRSGSKVHLGVFPEGVSIGWVLLADSWDGNVVNFNKTKLYSNPDFNPEASAVLRQHNVQLYHQQRGMVLIGFEDITRDRNDCDNDFNDAIFYVTSNPITAIDNGNLPVITNNVINDSDNDGVDDNSDDYPNDPTKAFDNYYPYQGGFSSVAFEDLWPAEGDYDFNDLVVDMNCKHITNSANYVVEAEYIVKINHIGAAFHNGFGIQFPFAPSDVLSATGFNHTESSLSLAANGLENGQSQAVVIVFDDAFNNEDQVLTIKLKMSNPYNFSALNQVGLDPFIFVNNERGKEVHLPGMPPTSLVNANYFGQVADASDGVAGNYYRTGTNKPWAVEINNSYAPPAEKVPIEQAYLHFMDWVNSGGRDYKDWYSNTSAGYRNDSKIQY